MIRRYARSPFIRSVGTLASGAAAAQVIAAAFVPFITRLYGPEAYGTLGVFLAVVAILSTIGGFAYPLAIVLPESDERARVIAKLSIVLSVLTALASIWLLLVLPRAATTWLAARGLQEAIYIVPLVIVLVTMQSVARQWLIRQGSFGTAAGSTALQALLTNLAKIWAGSAYPIGITLVAIASAAPGLHTLLMWGGLRKLMARRSEPSRLTFLEQFRELWHVARTYRDFPVFRAPQVLLNTLSQGLPAILLTSTFGAAAAGYFAVSHTVMGLPSALIGKSVGEAFYPRVTRVIDGGGNARNMIVKGTVALAVVASAPFLVVIVSGPTLFQVAFGTEWKTAGTYAQWLTIIFFFNLINKPSVAAVPALGLQGRLLTFELTSMVLKIGSLVLGFVCLNNPVAAIAAFSAVGGVCYAAFSLYVIKKAGEQR